jgi:thymidylate synthase (FAD)
MTTKSSLTTPLIHVSVLDHGFVELWNSMGDDQTVAASARVSLNRELASLTDHSEKQAERDRGLINRLMRDRHTSPFESVVFQWRIRTPIFVARQWFRHRFSSMNEESGRYVELKDEFYVPQQLRARVGKAMDYTYADLEPGQNAEFVGRIEGLYREARTLYEDMLAAGVAREHARMVLPVAQYTTFIWTVNALSLMNFLHLRNSPHAQEEIRVYAEVMEGVFAERLPWTHAAFRQHWGAGMV